MASLAAAASATLPAATAEKALAYEALINERLKVKLGLVLDERDRVHGRIADWCGACANAPGEPYICCGRIVHQLGE